MYAELIKNCTKHEFEIHNGFKLLRIMPKGLYGYIMSLGFELSNEYYNQPSKNNNVEYIDKIYYKRR